MNLGLSADLELCGRLGCPKALALPNRDLLELEIGEL